MGATQATLPASLPQSARFRRDFDGALHKVVDVDGVDHFVVRWTDSCPGCLEGGEYMGRAADYPYDIKAGCHVGAGCDECGHTGKRRREELVPFNFEEVA